MLIPRAPLLLALVVASLSPASGFAPASLSLRMSGGDGSKKIALVTGSTDGIGQHTATKLAQDGFKVLIHGRSQKRIDATVQRIRDKAPGCELDTFLADFASLDDVKRLGKELHTRCPRIDVLINNAGVFTQSMQKTKDGNELTFQVNVLAPFLLTSLVLDLVGKSDKGKVIIVSSISQSYAMDFDNLQMQKGFSDHTSYSLSKLCNAMHTIELAERLKKAMPGVTVNTLDPGTVNTKMLEAGWGMCGIDIARANYQHTLATDPSLDGETGQYYVGGRNTKASPPCYDPEQRERLWRIMTDLTGAEYPPP